MAEVSRCLLSCGGSYLSYSYGLAAIQGFIGVKLILHALHENNLPLVNDGQPVQAFEISTGLSLTVIIGVLVVTVVASLLSKECVPASMRAEPDSPRHGA